MLEKMGNRYSLVQIYNQISSGNNEILEREFQNKYTTVEKQRISSDKENYIEITIYPT